jgi:CBS domain-containing protein
LWRGGGVALALDSWLEPTWTNVQTTPVFDTALAPQRPFLRQPRGLFAFATDSSANALVEYALLLALLAGGLIVGAQVIGWTTRDVLSKGDLRLALNGASPKAADGPVAAQASDPPPPAAAAFDWFTWIPTVGLCLALAACGGAWRFVRRERRIQALEAQPAEPAPDDPAQRALLEKRRKILAALAADPSGLFDSRLQVRHLMTEQVESVRPDAPLAGVHEKLLAGRRRHLPVCESGGRLVGIISDRDLRKPGRRAADIMTPKPCTVTPDMLIVPAVTVLLNHCISCVPVVQGDRLCGLVTTTDLLMALQCALQALQRMPNAVKAMAAVAINESAAAAAPPLEDRLEAHCAGAGGP